MESPLEQFHRILKECVDLGASDVHIKVETPVVLRISRELRDVDIPFPSIQWMDEVIETITPVHLKADLAKDRECDFSYLAPHIGRFRTNIFQQRGTFALAMRYVKASVPSM